MWRVQSLVPFGNRDMFLSALESACAARCRIHEPSLAEPLQAVRIPVASEDGFLTVWPRLSRAPSEEVDGEGGVTGRPLVDGAILPFLRGVSSI